MVKPDGSGYLKLTIPLLGFESLVSMSHYSRMIDSTGNFDGQSYKIRRFAEQEKLRLPDEKPVNPASGGVASIRCWMDRTRGHVSVECPNFTPKILKSTS